MWNLPPLKSLFTVDPYSFTLDTERTIFTLPAFMVHVMNPSLFAGHRFFARFFRPLMLACTFIIGPLGFTLVAEKPGLCDDPKTLPNIIFILADDIGFGDLGCYGATHVKTPNLDRLAKAGTRFTDAHSTASVCTPTRYALLSGRYAWRQPGTGIASGNAPLLIPPGTVTVPSILKQAGYKTGVVGKWHLGLGVEKPDYNGELKPGPLELGFD